MNRLETGGANPTIVAPPAASAKPAAPADKPPVVRGDAGALAKGADERGAYNAAFDALKAGQYVDSARLFSDFLQQYPSGAYAPNALYWLGESYYATTNYPVALESFQRLLSQFPQSEKAPDALLKVGYSQLELKQTAAARTTLTQVTAKYPGTKVASLAQERLQRLQLQSGN